MPTTLSLRKFRRGGHRHDREADLARTVERRLFREFAITVSAAIVMSGLISLTVTPMMCARLIRHHRPEEHGRAFRVCEGVFDSMLRFYDRGLRAVLRHPAITLAVTIATLAATIYGYTIVPKGFFPEQDTGLILGVAEAAPDISSAAMAERIQGLGRIVMTDPDVDNVYYWIGPNPTVSQGRMMINLKPRSDRAASATQIIARLKPKLAQVEGIALFMQVRQDIQVGGRPSKTQYQYTLQDGNSDELARWAPILEKNLKSLPQLQDVTADIQASAPRATLRIDRDTASRLGVTPQAIDDTLYDAFGQQQVATVRAAQSISRRARARSAVPARHWRITVPLCSLCSGSAGATQHIYPRRGVGCADHNQSPSAVSVGDIILQPIARSGTR